jgi:hypothetical protein
LAKANAADEWITSGHSEFLVNRILESGEAGTALVIQEMSLPLLRQSCKPENLPYRSLMYYAGYTTIKSYDHSTNMVSLGPPNESIFGDIFPQIMDAMRADVPNEYRELTRELVETMFEGKSKEKDLGTLLNQALANVPHQLLRQNQVLESTYNVFFSTIIQLGCYYPIEYKGGEISFSRGDIELVLEDKLSNTVTIIEFKAKKSTQSALSGIIKRGHYLKYPKRKLIFVGINITKDKVVEVVVNDAFDADGTK